MLHYQKPTLRVIICCILVSVISAGCLLTDPVTLQDSTVSEESADNPTEPINVQPVFIQSVSDEEFEEVLAKSEHFKKANPDYEEFFNEYTKKTEELMETVVNDRESNEKAEEVRKEIHLLIDEHLYYNDEGKQLLKDNIDKKIDKFIFIPAPDSKDPVQDRALWDYEIKKEFNAVMGFPSELNPREKIRQLLTLREMYDERHEFASAYIKYAKGRDVETRERYQKRLSLERAIEIIKEQEVSDVTPQRKFLNIYTRFGWEQNQPDYIAEYGKPLSCYTYLLNGDIERLTADCNTLTVRYVQYGKDGKPIYEKVLFRGVPESELPDDTPIDERIKTWEGNYSYINPNYIRKISEDLTEIAQKDYLSESNSSQYYPEQKLGEVLDYIYEYIHENYDREENEEVIYESPRFTYEEIDILKTSIYEALKPYTICIDTVSLEKSAVNRLIDNQFGYNLRGYRLTQEQYEKRIEWICRIIDTIDYGTEEKKADLKEHTLNRIYQEYFYGKDQEVRFEEIRQMIAQDYPNITQEQADKIFEIRKKAYPYLSYPYDEAVIVGNVNEKSPKITYSDFTAITSENENFDDVLKAIEEIQPFPDFIPLESPDSSIYFVEAEPKADFSYRITVDTKHQTVCSQAVAEWMSSVHIDYLFGENPLDSYFD